MNPINKILIAITSLLLSWGGASCSKENMELPGQPGYSGAATLGISLGVEKATGAGGRSNFEPGHDYENLLDIANNNYRIYFFSYDNKYISTFNPYIKPALNQTPENINGVDTYFYDFLGEVPSDLPLNFKLVVIANWRNYPEEATTVSEGEFKLVKGVTTIEDLCTNAGSQFDYLSTPADNGEWLSAERLIPFYGVREYDLTKIAPGSISDGKVNGDVLIDLRKSEFALPLLRAIARIEVIVDNDASSLSEVKMTKVNSKGYCAPHSKDNSWKYDFTDYFHGYEWDKDFTRALHLVGDNNDTDPQSLAFTKVSNRGDKDSEGKTLPEKWVAYMPEYRNIGVENFTAIEVTLANPDAGTPEEGSWNNPKKTIYFATDGTEASNGNNSQATAQTPGRYNIERNNIYRFTVGMNTKLTVDVDIQPFAEVKLSYDLGLQRDERGDLMVIPDSEGSLPKFFEEYMKYHQSKWPKDEVTKENLKREKGDYYAIVLGSDGTVENASVWLKDASGCRVLTNFALPDPNDEHCSTRKVTHFFNTTETTYYKDIDGDMRLFHYPNHSSVIIKVTGETCYKHYTKFGTENSEKKYFQVESWKTETNDKGEIISTECWFVAYSESTTETVTEGEGENQKTYLQTTTVTTFRLVDASTGEPTTGNGEDCVKTVTEVTKKLVEKSDE